MADNFKVDVGGQALSPESAKRVHEALKKAIHAEVKKSGHPHHLSEDGDLKGHGKL